MTIARLMLELILLLDMHRVVMMADCLIRDRQTVSESRVEEIVKYECDRLSTVAVVECFSPHDLNE